MVEHTAMMNTHTYLHAHTYMHINVHTYIHAHRLKLCIHKLHDILIQMHNVDAKSILAYLLGGLGIRFTTKRSVI